MTTTTKKKTFFILVSNHFLQSHPRAGDPTGFEDKILSGEKIHTIRANYPYWKPIADMINAGEAVLSVRKWTGKPYRSKQQEIVQLDEIGIEPFHMDNVGNVFTTNYNLMLTEIAKNDGLSVTDFLNWFGDQTPFTGAIIHFTDFRYGGSDAN